MHIVRAAFAVVLVAVVTSGCRNRPDEGTEEATIDVGGRERSYLYRLPPGHGADPTATWPLAILLHGQLGRGVNMEDQAHASSVADREGFVVIYPDGVDRSWNDYRGVTKASEQKVDDVAFIRALVDRFVAEREVDPKRVYVAGMSNGGMMSFRIACELGDRVAAIGAVGALMPANGADTCAPARPVSAMVIAGTEDPIVPYGGGTVARDLGEVLSGDATRARWVTLNACEPADPPRTIDGRDDGTRVVETRYPRCLEGSEVVFHAVEGGGHSWPSGDGAFPEIVTGKTSLDVDATEELFRFFARHTR
ncbi:MAG: dienelactone hydrolase family protein [Labilithrix sp.]|nr:dienelactone hydrolase family protein [Labilithrix sp.]MCW5814672.1 dienelactone hydrolase family protein [Labilithrix sp.]